MKTNSSRGLETSGLEPIREPPRRGGQSRFASRKAQNRLRPRRFSDRLLVCFTLFLLQFAHSALAWDPAGWVPPGLSPWVDIGPNLKASAEAQTGSAKSPYLSGPAVAVDRTNGDLYCLPIGERLWKSTDQGQTFKWVYKDAAWGYTSTNAFTVSPEGSNIGIFMGTAGYSLDGGTTFKYLGKAKPFQGGIVNWFEDAKRVLAFGAEGHFSINLSEDGGNTFADITTADNMQEPSNMALLDGGIILIQKGSPEGGPFPLLRRRRHRQNLADHTPPHRADHCRLERQILPAVLDLSGAV